MVGIKINSILLFEVKEQWYRKWFCEFQLLNFIPIFLQVLEVGHLKNVINRLDAQLLNEIIFIWFFKLDFWIPWVLKPLSSNFQQSPMTTDKEIEDVRKF